MTDLEKICADAYEARVKIGTLDTDIKNKVLNDAADNLLKAEKEILEATNYYKSAKPGSLAEKAGMVAKYNEKNSKKN